MSWPKEEKKIAEWKKNISTASKNRKRHPLSEETKKKISQSLMGHGFTDEARKKMSITRTGMKPSVESVRKRSITMKGHVVTKETRRKIGLKNSISLKGKVLSKEVRQKISKSMKGKNSRENNPMWIDGRTPLSKLIRRSTEYKVWRNKVFTRDNYTDLKTGIRGGKLHPHHILNFSQYPEIRFDVNNGVTLSEESHRSFHQKYGKENNTREQLEEFLRN
jgi:hypothetical protein